MKNTLYIKYGLILIAILLMLIAPANYIYNGISLCLFRNLTGILCPLCGMTRASCDLVHLRFSSAVQYNPAVVLLPLLLLSEILHDAFPVKAFRISRRIIFILFLTGLVILFAVRITMYFRGH